jgi:hypothetical protein
VIFRPNRDARDAWWKSLRHPRGRAPTASSAKPGVGRLKELLGVFVDIEDTVLARKGERALDAKGFAVEML